MTSIQNEVTDGTRTITTSLIDYHLAKQIKLPDTVPASAGGLNKTSNCFFVPRSHPLSGTNIFRAIDWDLEIRKRYSQPLASETGEFPDADAIHGRMVPICYEESLPNGCGASCAEFMATATEQYIKEVVSSVLSRTRSNIPAAGGNGIMTLKYRRQLEREEESLQRGEITRGIGNGLLPIEAREAGLRRGLGMGDLRLAVGVGGCELGQIPGVVKSIMGGWEEGVLALWQENQRETEEEEEMEKGGARTNGVTNGGYVMDDAADADEADWGWEGGAPADRSQLSRLLDDVLTVGS